MCVCVGGRNTKHTHIQWGGAYPYKYGHTSWLGTFSDGNGDYEDNEDCWWLIEAPGSAIITVSFSSFNTEYGADYVKIYRCDTVACESDSTELIASLSGSSWDSSIPLVNQQVGWRGRVAGGEQASECVVYGATLL